MCRADGRLKLFVFCRSLSRAVLVFLAATTLTACGTVPDRNPFQQRGDALAAIPGLPPDARLWGDEAPELLLDRLRNWPPEKLRQLVPSWYQKPLNFLAISGGGQDGAFGAGLIKGWTDSGQRPDFQMVTGVSTGALSAPFVFLGPDYDDKLKEVYTTKSTADLAEVRAWTAIATGDSAFDNSKLRNLISSYVDDEMIRRLGEEYRKGRRLFVGTTNLDAGRPVVWNITSIAASDYPAKQKLIVDILLASASIPGVFPPVLVRIPVGDQTFDELHVDGGAVTQVFVYPASLDFAEVLDRIGIDGSFTIYVIRNSKLKPKWKPVEAGIFEVTATSIASLIRTQGIGDLSSIYLLSQRDGGQFRLTYVPDDFDVDYGEMFDPDYMKALYEVGYRQGLKGGRWDTQPPATKTVEIE